MINRQNIKKDDMEQRSKLCIFLSYSTIHNSCFLCFELTYHKAYFSRHFHFIQNHFPSFWLPSMSVTKSMILPFQNVLSFPYITTFPKFFPTCVTKSASSCSLIFSTYLIPRFSGYYPN